VSLLRHHILLMFIYAILAGAFFSLLWKEEQRERIRTFLVIFCSLFLGGLALGWVMFPLPLK
jgi:cytochrome bd-type quinol oxidase subunit 2